MHNKKLLLTLFLMFSSYSILSNHAENTEKVNKRTSKRAVKGKRKAKKKTVKTKSQKKANAKSATKASPEAGSWASQDETNNLKLTVSDLEKQLAEREDLNDKLNNQLAEMQNKFEVQIEQRHKQEAQVNALEMKLRQSQSLVLDLQDQNKQLKNQNKQLQNSK